jgi:hypothetical protein
VATRARDALEYFEKLEEMFGTEGWRLVIEEAKAQVYQYQADVLEAKTWDEVCELRGHVTQLSRLINLESGTALLKQQAESQVLIDESDDDADL